MRGFESDRKWIIEKKNDVAIRAMDNKEKTDQFIEKNDEIEEGISRIPTDLPEDIQRQVDAAIENVRNDLKEESEQLSAEADEIKESADEVMDMADSISEDLKEKGNDNRSVRHVIFIEEAHNLIANATGETVTGDANPKVAATNYIVKMLAEVRALREGIIIADQLPTVMAAEVLKNTGLKIVHRLTAGDDRAVIGEMMSANGMQIESIATYMPGDALISYEGLMRPFKMKIAEFNLKDAPATEKLYELMSIRDLQRHISKETFAIRLQKNKQNWMKEWRIAVVVFEQLQNDCSKIDMIESINEYEILVNTIVKDQIGVEKCINKLKKLVKKYKNTLDLAMEVDYEDNEFYRHMNESIQKLIKNTQIVLQKDRRNVK